MALSVLLSCCFMFFYVKRIKLADKSDPQENSDKTEALQKKLKRHGNLDRLVHQDYLFVKAQKKNNSAFFQDNVKHLEAVNDRLRDIIFRKKNICQSLTQEYALVKEQLMLMQYDNVTQPDYELARENCENLSLVLQKLSKVTEQEQDALLMLENIKCIRSEQLRITNLILVRHLDVKNKKQTDEVDWGSEEQNLDKNENKQVAWKK